MMMRTTFLFTFLFAFSTAQILTNGIGTLPSCAQTCPSVTQAVSSCNGGSSSDLSTWSCFCSYIYSKTAFATSTSICHDVCGVADWQQFSNWYTANCGSDNGAAEHAAGGTGTTTATSAGSTSTTTGTVSSGTGVAGQISSDGSPGYTGTWWSAHYQYVIMIIVIVVGLLLITVLLIWLKRRYERRQDRPTGGFNEGITMRGTPMISMAAAPAAKGSGRDSPARTREAFMPYGYGYSRSETRLGSQHSVAEMNPGPRSSPLAHDGTTMGDLEKSGLQDKKRRVLVRERSMSQDPEKR